MTTLQSHPVLTLAWRPFLDPLNLHDHWYFLIIPLSLGIALTYKAVRLHDLKHLVRQTLLMAVQIILGMIALALAAYLLIELYVNSTRDSSL